MTDPSEKELIEHLNDFMDCVHPFRLGSYRDICGYCPECQAIRRLIVEQGEWKKRANQIMGFGKDENKRLLELEELAREIRDFGKEAPDD
jgi:hypothetical protein